MKYKTGAGSKLFDLSLNSVMLIIIVVTLLPFINVLAVSLSGPLPVAMGSVTLIPKEWTIESYKLLVFDPVVWRSLSNSVIYAMSGMLISVLFSAMFAYAISVRTYKLRYITTFVLIITMFFSGGIIPSYLVMRELGLINTLWAMILPGAVSAWNVMILRSFFMGIPESLRESAKIDGANDIYILFKIIMPLSKPVLMVIALFCIIGHWNDFFSALLYLTENNKYPLQMVLRNILFQSTPPLGGDARDMLARSEVSPKNIQNAMIIFTTFPVICIYPFMQKYFIKGMLIGSIKG